MSSIWEPSCCISCVFAGECQRPICGGSRNAKRNSKGVDFFVQLNRNARIFAFQFKAPRSRDDQVPYRFTLVGEQHAPLYALAQASSHAVFYVLPFYASHQKLQRDVPALGSGHVVATDCADGAIPGVRHEQDQGGALLSWQRDCKSGVSASTCAGSDVVTGSRHPSAGILFLVHVFAWRESSVDGAFAENESVGCSRFASRHHRIRGIALSQQHLLSLA